LRFVLGTTYNSCGFLDSSAGAAVSSFVARVWNNRPVTSEAANPHNWFMLACVAGTVLLLLLLIVRLRLHPALALASSALMLGAVTGMPLRQVPLSFTAGVGAMMGHIAIILGMGAVLGKLLASSGAAASLSRAMVEGCGERGLPWVLLALGVLVGMPVFFEVGLVLLMPIIVAAAQRTGRPPILVSLPVMAGLSAMHGLVPPHPAAMLATTAYHADVGRSIFWGLVVGIPAAALAGPVLGLFLLRRWKQKQTDDPAYRNSYPMATTNLPAGSNHDDTSRPALPAPPAAGPISAIIAILLPIVLIFLGSWADSLATPGSLPNQILHLVGYPDVAMLLAVLVALVTLGRRVPRSANGDSESLRRLTWESFEPIANALVILSAAGGLSGILRDSGAAQATVGLALGAHMPPLVLAWVLAAIVRVSMGSATVAMAVASGVLAPMAGHLGVPPEMLVLATGSGSLLFSHVNDSGFWLIVSLFNIDVKQTLATWSILETVLSVAGLGGTLLLSVLLR
jgi:gluconate:H+ symporter, GntP family